MALAWNRDPREIRTHRRAQSAGAQSALGRKPAEERVFRPTLRHLADRIGYPAPRQIPARPDCDRARPLRRPPLGHALAHARCADFGDRDPCGSRRGAGARGRSRIIRTRGRSRCWRSRCRISKNAGRATRTAARACRRRAPTRHEKRHGALAGRSRRRQDPRSFRMGGDRLRLGRAGAFPLRAGRISRARRKRPLTIAARALCAAARALCPRDQGALAHHSCLAVGCFQRQGARPASPRILNALRHCPICTPVHAKVSECITRSFTRLCQAVSCRRLERRHRAQRRHCVPSKERTQSAASWCNRGRHAAATRCCRSSRIP